MKLVVDANILFAAMIKGGVTSALMLSDEIQLVAPEFVLSEIKKHKDEILTKTHRNPEELNKFLLILEEKIEVIPSSEIQPFLSKAASLLGDNIKDLHYIATAFRYRCSVWSNDANLKKQQTQVQVYSTSELIDEINKQSEEAA